MYVIAIFIYVNLKLLQFMNNSQYWEFQMGLLLLTLKTISGILISIVIDFFLLDRNGANKVSCLQSDIKIAFNCIESWCMEVKGFISVL